MRKYQHYDSGDDSARDAYGNNWIAQTFTPGTDQLIGSVKLKLYRIGSPGTVKISIKATSGGKPTGGDLCSGKIKGTNITTDANGEWYEISLGNGFNLDIGATYAIVVRAPEGSSGNEIDWRADGSSPTYSDGLFCNSSDSGSTWSQFSGVDALFETWGTGPPSPTTVVWGNLNKSQVSSEKIEEAIDRLVGNHNDNPNSHLEADQALQSHKAAEIIDHAAGSVVTDKIKEEGVTNPKIAPTARAYDAIVDAAGGTDYTDIQSAIDYVNGLAQNGGNILILPGTYTPKQNLNLYDNISIEGIDPKSTIIDFEEQEQWRLKIIGEDSPYSTGTISGSFLNSTITGSSTAWSGNVSAGDYIRINGYWYEIESVTDDTHLELIDNWQGEGFSGKSYVIASFSKNISIEKLTIKNAGMGGEPLDGNIMMNFAADVVLRNCRFFGGYASAFVAENCFDITVEGCHTYNNNYGPRLKYTSYSILYSNNFEKDGAQVDLENSHKNLVINNFIHKYWDNMGLRLYHSSYNSVVNNKIAENYTLGLKINEASNNQILGNTIHKNGRGTSDSDGMRIEPSNNNIISNNVFINNKLYGLHIISGGDQNIVMGNQFKNNGSGAYVDNGTGNEIAHNIT